ncbi:MAG: hypothetical protein NTV58_17805 [Deltaproteobacteria bacterium]|nr:hypothetical protein [Deltaproteobacteria bacterium]
MLPSSLRSLIAYNILFPGEDLLRRVPINKFFRFYRKAQWWSREENDRYKQAALKRLIQHAYQTVPYYHRTMKKAGIVPDDIREPGDLSKLPFLTRKDVLENLQDLISTDHSIETLKKGASSGSTGQVVVSYRTRTAIGAAFGAERIGWEMAGYRFGARNVTVWGNRITVEEQWTTWHSRLKQWAYRNKRIGAYLLTDDRHVRDALKTIHDWRPDYLNGYPNAIYFLALKAKEFGVGGLACKGVLTTAETVYDFQRAMIGEVFGPVYDGYGSGEISGVAYQCKAGGFYHIVEPHVIVEYADCGGDEFKELVLTNLDNYGMPFIRYKVGDLAVLANETCSCGRHWATLKKIAGRTADLITTPTGGALLVPSFFGSSLISQLPKIQQYQIAKVTPNRITIRIQASPHLSQVELDLIRRQIAPHLEGKIEYDIEQVEKIALTKAGKFKLVIDETKPL